MDADKIAAELLCKLSRKLPNDPVVADNGSIYERSELESAIDSYEGNGNPKEFYPSSQIKRVIELLVSSGDVDEKYLGGRDKEIKLEGEGGTNNPLAAGTPDEEIESNSKDASSLVELGELCLNGIGLGKDEKKAYHCFCAASEKGNELGTARKADCILAGLGVQRDHDEGYSELVEAATGDKKSAHAITRLWYYYSEGIYGFGQDRKKEAKWLKKWKEISPQLSERDIDRVKQELADLIAPPSIESEEHNQVTLPMDKDPGPLGDLGNACHNNNSPATTVEPTQSASTTPNCTPDISNQDFMLSTSSTELVKQCHSCGESKPKSAFSLSEWEQPARAGSCLECCEKESNATNSKQCSSCGQSKPATNSTSSQLNQSAGSGRCIDCGKKDAPTSESSAPVDVNDEKDVTRPKPESATQHIYVKLCFDCKQSKPQTDFTASQWKKRVGTGKCITCVSKSVQWQTGSVGSSLQMKACGECNVSKPHTDFSPNQWRKTTGTGRCKECVVKSLRYGG